MAETRAINRYVGSSPRKMRLVIDLIRGKSVPEALTILHFSTKHPAKIAEKVLRSAVSNYQNKDHEGRTEIETLFVKKAFVDPGPSMKRILPAPMGRAFRIVKRSNHVTIVVDQREKRTPRKGATVAQAPGSKAKAVKPQAVKAQAAKATKKTAKE